MTRVRIPQPDTEEDVSAERLIESAVAAGRYVHVTTYHDGATPIRASLLFKTAADAATCARVLSKATVGSAVLADIVGPARAASVGAACRGEESREQKFARARCHVRMASARYREEQTEQEAKRAAWEAAHLYVDTAEDSAARGAGESEGQ